MKLTELFSGNLAGLLLLAAVFYGALVLFVYLSQSRLLYLPDLPSRTLGSNPQQAGMAYQDVALDTEDHVRLHGWFIAAPPERRRASLLFFHGNAGNISHRLESIAIFHELGLDVLIIDYRGYGQSTGRPSEKGTARDARAAWVYLAEQRGIPANEIILFGRSLGAAIAARLATEISAGGLILESGYTSVPDLAARVYPFLPVRLLSRFRYDTRKALANVACPVLVIHSREDEIVPFAHGEALYAAAREPKQLLVIRGGHNDGFWISKPDYMAGLARFLDTAQRMPAPG
jgi:fermentation-respiration switch protein FrsA (DUF1100 family)